MGMLSVKFCLKDQLKGDHGVDEKMRAGCVLRGFEDLHFCLEWIRHIMKI